MIPGVPVDADDSLDLKAMGAAIKAAEDAQSKFRALGQTLVGIRIWKGRLIATGSEKQAFVYFLPCARCKEKNRQTSV